MKINSPAGNRLFIGILALLVSQFVITNCAQAQTTTCRQNQVPCFGDKAVYGLVGTSVTVVPSQVWIDASAFWTSGVKPDICGIINGILTSATYPYPSSGAVIDARGLVHPNSTLGVIACSGNPFQGVSVPSTILLPAAQIPIQSTWFLPNNTKIIGEGAGTWLQATANNPTGYMIEMGSSTSCPSEGCSGVAIEHIQLDASNFSIGGIHNQFSQTPSYVNDVVLANFSLIGLKVEGPGAGGTGAIDSGPYTNITFTAGATASCTSSGCPMCVDLEAQTRGLHGITCLGNVNTAGVSPKNPGYPAIMVNASNNSIDDVHVESFWDGVEVGNTTSQVGNISISNITGSSTGGCQQDCPTTNTVHICGIVHPQSGTFGVCSMNNGGSANTVSDVTVLQTAVTLNENDFPATAIEDDVTGTSIIHCASCGVLSATAMYVLGEPVQASGSAIGYSRFATALGPGTNNPGGTVVPTWGVGTTAASGGTCNTPGALYSNSGASGGLFVCAGNPNTWQLIAP